jgi:hypothetical protein
MTRFLIFALMVGSMTPFAGCSGNSGTSRVHKEGSYFEVALPAGWTVQTQGLGLSQEEKKVYGVTLAGPATPAAGQGSAPRISALYYAPDNLMDKTPEKFINVHSSEAPKDGVFPALPKVEGGKIGGLPARVFGNVTSERGARRTIDSKGTVVWESFAVVPLKKGYYVLRYTAPADKYNGRLKVFEAFIASFKPLLK